MANFDFFHEVPVAVLHAQYTDMRNCLQENFLPWFDLIKKQGVGRIEADFTSLESLLESHGQTYETWTKNANCNRYQDMPCFEKTRVVLRDGLSPDYVHANFVSGYKRPNAYILTQ
uniref:Tyrosine-protein phosphatase domain-containing protein n=1 Tax=Romanomermis culicivorax TaxID=13658 RepID=A0A915K4D3_ROMCU